MKFYIVEINYIVPIEKIEELTNSHREYLQRGYSTGLLLVSGPKVPRTGGIVIAKSDSLDSIKDFFANDPYALNNAAQYRFVEFFPKSHQKFLDEWLSE